MRAVIISGAQVLIEFFLSSRFKGLVFVNAPQVCAPSERPPLRVRQVPAAVSDRAGRLGSCVLFYVLVH